MPKKPFSVRIWLAEEIGCKAGELTVVEWLPPDESAFEIQVARRGVPFGHVYLMVPERGSVTLLAAWQPGRSAHRVLPRTADIEW